jgi:predicted DsbA family dithiol-disulfide isomerase
VPTMRVEIWSDVVCPWCYIGKRRLEAALARFPHGDDVEVVWRSFELDPSAPPVRDVTNVERLARKYGVSVEQAQAMLDRMTSVADGEGLHFRLDIARSGNTFDAHRLLHLAGDRGVQGELKEALLAAYQIEGEAISDHEMLTTRAVAAGLDEAEVRDVLTGDRYTEEVRRDEAEAHSIGVSGVPHFVVDRRYAIPGAQDSDVLLQVLERAWSEHAPVDVIAGDACDIDGCE